MKISILSTLLATVLSTNSVDTSYYATYSYIYNQNNTKIKVLKYNQDYLTDEEIEEKDEESKTAFPSIETLEEPTLRYNCHSYSFYSKALSNWYWIVEPEKFIDDGTFISSDGSVGDVVVYLDSSSNIIHSGIVNDRLSSKISGKNDLDNIVVDSKWGDSGLYRHSGKDTPYYGGMSAGVTDNIAYYKVNSTHTHSYIYNYVSISTKKHYAYCRCGSYLQQAHTVNGTFSSFEQYKTCIHCGSNAEVGLVIQNTLTNTSLKENIDYSYENEMLIFNKSQFLNGVSIKI